MHVLRIFNDEKLTTLLVVPIWKYSPWGNYEGRIGRIPSRKKAYYKMG